MKKPELLAPAGNMEALRAAIAAGCDAVYLGGKLFGARSFAGNFSDEELIEAVRLCHLYNVKVYVTTNIIVYEREVDNFLKYVEFLYKNNVDALIIQDIGMMDVIRQKYPDIELHASTQMHIHNLDGAKVLEELGIKRTVLARETSIDDIKKIRNNTNIQLEIFVHGALCVSYSGQCFMSTLIGNRSGNRGTCAQCCREVYSLMSNDDKNMTKITDGYLLSTKDLNTLNDLGKLIDLGIDSIKIEGRMKRSEYVYYVVSLYRKAIDSYIEKGKIEIDEKEITDLKKLFNRGFTKGFVFNEDNNNFINSFRPNHMGVEVGKVIKVKGNWCDIKLSDDLNIKDGIRIIGNNDIGLNINDFYINKKLVKEAHKNDIISLQVKYPVKEGSKVLKTTDNKEIEELDKLIDLGIRIPVDMKVEIHKDELLYIRVSTDDKTIEYKSDYRVESAVKESTSKDRIIEQLSKLGNSVYKINSIDVNMDDNLFVNIKEINNLRRCAIEKLDEERLKREKRRILDYHVELKDYPAVREKTVLIRSREQYNQVKGKFDKIYMDNKLYNIIDDYNKVLKLPRVIKEYIPFSNEIMIGEVGGLKKYDNVTSDFSLNVVNSYSVAFLHSVGVNKVTLSYELTYEQTRLLVEEYKKRYNKKPNLEIIVFGYMEAMINKYNLYKKYKYNNLYLKDKMDKLYQIKDYGNYMVIYDHKLRRIKEDYYQIGVNSSRVELLNDTDYKKIK